MKKLVIDISHWDGDIDLSAWKRNRGLWGVLIKAGGRETGLGRYRTSTFERQYKKAQAAGLHIGAYYYTVTTDKANAKLDADHFAGLIAGKKFDLPVYMDVEDQRQFGLSRRVLTDVILTFCNAMKGHGYFSGLYTGGSAWLNNMYREELLDLADWIAWWRKEWPSEAGDIGMWQQGGMRLSDGAIVYADRAGYTDCDWCVVDYPATIGKAQGAAATQAKPTTEAQSTSTSSVSQPVRGTADSVIKIAEGELGYYAPDDPLTGSKYGRWMAKVTGESWMAGPSKSIWWCCMFVSWVLNQAGIVVKGFPSQNTDVALAGGAKNYLVSDKRQIRRGDILIFDWNWNTAATDHIGFAKAAPSGGYVSTIEGNVGNAVQNKTRALSSIRYVVRPQYAGTSTESAATPAVSTQANNRAGGKLDVDGSIGYNTIVDWQDQLGTPCDGEVWGQVRSNYRFFPSVVERCLTSWDESGSALIKAVQSKVGADADGIWGYKTSRAIQNWLIKAGYSCGASGADGWFGSDSAKALQRSLNDGKWK